MEAKFAEAAEVRKTDLVPSICHCLKEKEKGAYTAGTYWYRRPFRPVYEHQINN